MRKHLIWLPIIMQMTTDAQVHFGLWGGLNYSRISIRDFASSTGSSRIEPGASVNEKHRVYYRNSFFAGVKTDVELANGLAVSANLILENTGFQDNLKQWYYNYVGAQQSPSIFDSLAGKDIVRTIYLSAPVHLVFATPIGNARFLVGAGAYVSCGLTGNSDFTKLYSTYPFVGDSVKPITFSTNSHFQAEFYHASRIDYGLSVMMGLQLRNKIFLEAIMENGFKSVFKDRFVVKDVNNKIVFSAPNKRRVMMIGFGYRFK